MKILGLCGSLATNSVNLRILNALGEWVGPEHSYSVATLGDIPMFRPDLEPPASVKDLGQQVAEADRVIIGTPEYNYSLPGVLKNALDWLSRDPGSPFNNKITAIIGASPGKVGTARAQYHLRQVGVFLNIRFINKPEVMIGECNQKVTDEGQITDARTAEHLQKMLAALVAG